MQDDSQKNPAIKLLGWLPGWHSMTGQEFISSLEECAEDYEPAPNRVVIEGDFRPRITLPGHVGRLMSDFTAELGDQLRDKPIFNRGGRIQRLNEENQKLEQISPSAFRSIVERWIVYQNWVGRGEDCRLEDMTMNEECAKAAMVSPDLLSRLRSISRINSVRQPVTRSDGTVELLPAGYDDASQIFTFDNVDFDEEMELADAAEIIEGLLVDCAFADADRQRSKAATIAMMLAVFCDCMFDALVQRPAFVIQGNTSGAGKTTLCRLAVCPVFGSASLTPPPNEDSGKVAELLSTLSQSAAPYVVFDNWRGKIQSAPLEAFITARKWSGRILGTSYAFTANKECLVFITSNDGVVNDDMRRRSLVIELFVEQVRAEDRPVSRSLDEDDIIAQRSQILGALWTFVRHWIAEGSTPSTILHGTFRKWGDVIAGMVEALGLANPLLPPKLKRGGDDSIGDFTKIAEEVFQGSLTSEVMVKPGELLEVARKVGAFGGIINSQVQDASELSEKALHAEYTRFGHQCSKLLGRIFPDGTRFDSLGQGHSKRYTFTRPPENSGELDENPHKLA